jgi:hypothetical protein
LQHSLVKVEVAEEEWALRQHAVQAEELREVWA